MFRKKLSYRLLYINTTIILLFSSTKRQNGYLVDKNNVSTKIGLKGDLIKYVAEHYQELTNLGKYHRTSADITLQRGIEIHNEFFDSGSDQKSKNDRKNTKKHTSQNNNTNQLFEDNQYDAQDEEEDDDDLNPYDKSIKRIN